MEGGRRLKTSHGFGVTVDNASNYQYHGSLFLGSDRQEMSFILDTGSSWMWIPDYQCPLEECSGFRYNSAESDTFKKSSKMIDIVYGRGYVEGYLAEDQITYMKEPSANRQIADKMHFLVVYHAQELEGLVSDGLLGLAPKAA